MVYSRFYLKMLFSLDKFSVTATKYWANCCSLIQCWHEFTNLCIRWGSWEMRRIVANLLSRFHQALHLFLQGCQLDSSEMQRITLEDRNHLNVKNVCCWEKNRGHKEYKLSQHMTQTNPLENSCVAFTWIKSTYWVYKLLRNLCFLIK